MTFTPRSALKLALLASVWGTPVMAQEAAEPPAQVDEIVVTGRVQKLYRADQTTIGKLPADPLDIPQATQVITQQLIQDLGARQVSDLYRNVSGVSFYSYGGITFRGFRQSQSYQDGLRGFPYDALFSVPELYNVERVEFLKGPAGMLYGPGSPGGTINYVTKKPTDTFQADIRGVLGNYDRFGGSAAISGPLLANGAITYRVGGFYENKDDFRDNASSETTLLDAALRFRLATDTHLTVQANLTDQNLPGNRLRGVPTDAQGNFLAPVSFNVAEPTDFLNVRAEVYQALFESKISDSVSFNAAARFFQYDNPQLWHSPASSIDTNGDGRVDVIKRTGSDQVLAREGPSANANLIAKAGLFGMKHTVLLGGDWASETATNYNRQLRSVRDGGPVPDLSIANPVYGSDLSSYPSAPRPLVAKTRAIRYGIYIQDQIEIGDHVILTGGLRQDWFRDANLLNTVRFNDQRMTKRVGAIYKPRSDISVYLSYSDTFEPQGAANQDPRVGGPFAPVTGDQIEGGIKTALFGGRVQSGLAIYRIVRANLLQSDTTKPPVNGLQPLAPVGEVTSKGVEFDLAADLTKDWVLTANYAYNDTKITGTIPGQTVTNAVGNRFANAPRHKLGLWTRYQVAAIDTAFAFGSEYVSSRLGDGGARVKPYTIFDASIIKSFGNFEVLLRAKNLFDKKYALSGFDYGPGNAVFPGEPRTVFAELRAKF